jgi:type III secretion protein V
MGALQRFAILASSRNDLVLAVILVSIVFMMILPLPVLVVDILIGLNMTISAVLLMVALYLPTPLAFSSFPSVLLVTTLFRLGISIATTRLILLQGDAGSIIETFGNFVVGGNLVVGLVVFLILTIVQFVVITKGAERVAEVAARFSLDAMPGKQMSIDGDMRAGTIDMAEAKRRRQIVEKESQLYGAMDGAMKFVKGDAIAGIIIVAINLLGGMMIGVLQRGMPADKAVQTYSILSIGDGLIAQIPALFIAICAGVIVTRVQSGDEPSNVGKDIGAQVLAQPRALMIGGAIALGMGLIPGMPTPVFLVLALGLIGLGVGLRPRRQVDDKTGEVTEVPALAPSSGTKPARKNDGTDEFVPTVPLILDVADGLRKSLDANALNDGLIEIRRSLYFELGVPFPGIFLRFGEGIEAGTYSVLLSEVRRWALRSKRARRSCPA